MRRTGRPTTRQRATAPHRTGSDIDVYAHAPSDNAGSEQRQRLQEAAKRRLAARNSRRPRARQNRIGNAAVRRDARALPRVRHSTAWLW
ncbi:hypothetical protein ACH4MA_20685 [Streptomyces roseolus]|uniref:hypothetical protein n=1 Tax=Streptomyces roseolus TaxID=67358 RepID=UPI0037B4DAB4